MRTKLFSVVMMLSISFLFLGNDGCNESEQKSISGAKQVSTLDFKIPLNANGLTTEQQNIIDRLRVTTDPTKVMWIHLIALDGNILRRMPIKNKVTSSGKRLEPVIAEDAQGLYIDVPGKGVKTAEMLQADGTFGNSDNYIFWFDPTMRYHQWGTAGGLGYLLTDYPINLEDPSDKITGLYNVSKVALEWQQKQEKKLRKQEGIAYDKYKKDLDSFEQKLKENNK